MKHELSVTVNIGNFESVRLGVSDADSFEVCEDTIIEHCKSRKIPLDKKIRQALGIDR